MSLAELRRGVLQRDMPGVLKAGIDIISSSDHWHTMMPHALIT